MTFSNLDREQVEEANQKTYGTREEVAGRLPCMKKPIVVHAKQINEPFRVDSLEGDYKQGKAGDYKFGNPMDQQFLAFTGISEAALLEQVKSDAGDWDVLLWVNEQANPRRAPHEIRAWSEWLETMPIGDAEDFEWFTAQVKRLNPARADLHTVMDYLDADDHASFGGRA